MSLLGATWAYAQATVLVAAVGNPEDPALSEVIGKAASIELQSAGLSSSVESHANSSQIDEATAQRTASSMQADFLLIIAYSQKASAVKMALSFRRVSDGTTIGHEEQTVPFDLNLDTHVSASVQSLLSEPAVENAIQGAIKKSRSARHPSSAPPSSIAGRTGGGAAPGKAPREPSPATTAGLAPTPRRLGFAWSMRGAPLLLVGNASNYFRYGAGLSMFTGMVFPRRVLTLEAGALTGAAQLFPAAGLSQGKVYTFLGGLQSRIGTRAGLPVQLSLRVAGGAAVIMLVPPSGSPEAKTDFFASGGLAASIRVFKAVEVGAELGLLAVFEERYPILAFAPSLTVGISP